MPNAIIKKVDMSDEMKEFAILVAKDALSKKATEHEAASEIRSIFQQKYGRKWHCLVGRHYAAFVTHEEGSYIYFYIGQTGITLFSTA